MACLKLEVDDVDEQIFGQDPAVTVETEEQKDTKDLLAQNEVDPGSNFNTVYGYGNVVTIAPLGDVLTKDESVGLNTEGNEFASVDTPEQGASCQLNSAHDIDTQSLEHVGPTTCVQQMSGNTQNNSLSTEAETMEEASNSQSIASYQGTASSGSSPVTDSPVTLEREKTLRPSDNLRQHVILHTDYGPHICQICGKTFKHQAWLSRHALTHTGERPHKCQLCDKAFASKRNLKIHYWTHVALHCKICGKSCRTSSILEQHSLTHTGEKPHKCELCDKTFSRQKSLKIHSLTHTREKSFKCETCGKCFITYYILHRHLLTHTTQKSAERRLLPKPQDTHLTETIEVYKLL